MKNKKRKNHARNSELSVKEILVRCLAFTALFCLIGFLIVLVASCFLYRTKDPTAYVKFAGVFSLFLSAFLTGFIQSKINRQHYFSSSLILGAFVFTLTLVTSLLTSNQALNITNFIWRILIIAFTVLGGMLGISREGRKRKHTR